ncbi:MAB_1171c family putative transporter [Streptomyces griseoluteus]|uniref:MAB_1171c family putative transporter n=1 Tax=Streptomyces griseoluteus TaxID=29306 RepID=UPI00367EF077
MNLSSLHIPYLLPALLLAVALVLKAPTFLRAWQDSDVRATTLLLLLAAAVFVSVPPAVIHRINTVTSVPNLAGAWVYSLLTAFCGSCLAMVVTWREKPSPRRTHTIRRIWLLYSGIIAALWATFLLAHVPDERIYDLDTYYATEPWMREHILLYLTAHMVSALVAAYLIWTWISQVRSAWLKAGLVFLQAGYAFGLVFDIAKFTAIGARWSGHDLDWLSTKVAPPFAILDASLVAVGFILPQAGPFLQKWIRDQFSFHRMRPLERALRAVGPSAARARVGALAPLDLRLLQRQQRIHDGLLRLAPYLDNVLWQRAFDAARAAGHAERTTRGIAGAITVQAALTTWRSNAGQPVTADRAGADALRRISSSEGDIDAISRALHRPRTLDPIRERMAPQETRTHA